MFVKLFLLPLIAVFICATSANAGPPVIKILGFEDGSCQAWTSSKDDPERRSQYIAWARGFLSGHNYANQSQQVTDFSQATIENFIENFCRQKPNAEFTEAAYRMSDQYSGRGKPISK